MAHCRPASYQVSPVAVSTPSNRARTVTIMARLMVSSGAKVSTAVPANSSPAGWQSRSYPPPSSCRTHRKIPAVIYQLHRVPVGEGHRHAVLGGEAGLEDLLGAVGPDQDGHSAGGDILHRNLHRAEAPPGSSTVTVEARSRSAVTGMAGHGQGHGLAGCAGGGHAVSERVASLTTRPSASVTVTEPEPSRLSTVVWLEPSVFFTTWVWLPLGIGSCGGHGAVLGGLHHLTGAVGVPGSLGGGAIGLSDGGGRGAVGVPLNLGGGAGAAASAASAAALADAPVA